MNFTKEDAKERLQESLAGFQHPTICDEVDYYFEDEDVSFKDYAGKLTIKCRNCGVQDHFLYHPEE